MVFCLNEKTSGTFSACTAHAGVGGCKASDAIARNRKGLPSRQPLHWTD